MSVTRCRAIVWIPSTLLLLLLLLLLAVPIHMVHCCSATNRCAYHTYQVDFKGTTRAPGGVSLDLAIRRRSSSSRRWKNIYTS